MHQGDFDLTGLFKSLFDDLLLIIVVMATAAKDQQSSHGSHWILSQYRSSGYSKD
jgi:hypothetical protein